MLLFETSFSGLDVSETTEVSIETCMAKLRSSTLNTRAQAVSHPICFDFLNETTMSIENKTANSLSFDICAVDNFLDTYTVFS